MRKLDMVSAINAAVSGDEGTIGAMKIRAGEDPATVTRWVLDQRLRKAGTHGT